MKKAVSLILTFIMISVVFMSASVTAVMIRGDANGDGAVNNKDVVVLFRYVSGDAAGSTVVKNCDYNGDGEINNKDVAALFRGVSDGTAVAVEEPETLQAGWKQTIDNANAAANGVQGRYTNTGRTEFRIDNLKSSVVFSSKKVTGIYNAAGSAYTTNVDAQIIASSKTYLASSSGTAASMNSYRIGYYYYDFHFLDQNFRSGTSSLSRILFDHTFHTYADKMYEELRAVASGNYSTGGKFESKIVIPSSSVSKLEIKRAGGTLTDVSGISGTELTDVEYIAFDINGAGVFGLIIPYDDCGRKTDGTTNASPMSTTAAYVKITLSSGNYEIIHGVAMPSLSARQDCKFGHRIYTSALHTFDDIRKEAYIERHPLTDITVSSVDNAQFLRYDSLCGFYKFTVKATGVMTAFPDGNKRMRINTVIKNDNTDRKIYIQTSENLADREGKLESAAILDENQQMLPIPIEVCKNFDGDETSNGSTYNKNVTYYLYETGSRTASFGETYLPLTLSKGETKEFTVLHLYQNWGNYRLKQLSSVKFHIPYYHLSLGVTETNCITPYFVYGKDGWTLPDFRAVSAPYWANGTGVDHTSVGRLYFLNSNSSGGKTESQSAHINSAGPVYADIDMTYLSDDGNYKATYRHVETAQTDENRTYYNIRIEVLKDATVSSFRDNFSFFTFDGRYTQFSSKGYLNESNQMTTGTATSSTSNSYITLGTQTPYFDYYGATNKGDSGSGSENAINFAIIVLRSDITLNGSKYTGSFVIREKAINMGSSWSGYKVPSASLTLNISGSQTLKKGDVMDLDVILLPWGYSTSTDDSNVRNVREDSGLDPFVITPVANCTLHEDRFIPSVNAQNNTATFRISGGANVAAVRVYGFTDYTPPTVTFKADGHATNIKLASEHGYDGYQVYLDGDGTYSFAFNVDMDAAQEYEITITQ
ncbi:MAG: dockerin type I repeat-containing protein [Clostridia bacterium]|nr:dockerin type I repeat-containing protein [Clostridia bacterium]